MSHCNDSSIDSIIRGINDSMIRIIVGPSDTNTPTRNHVPSSNSDSITIAMDNHHEHDHSHHHHSIIMKIYISKGSLNIDPQAINWIINSTTNTTNTGINSSNNNIYSNSDNSSRSRSSSSSSSYSSIHSQSKKEKAGGVRRGSVHSKFKQLIIPGGNYVKMI